MVKQWLKAIEDQVASAQAAGEEFGACMLPSPTGGAPICQQLDETTCTNLGGTFLGGDCGSAQAAESRKAPKKQR